MRNHATGRCLGALVAVFALEAVAMAQGGLSDDQVAQAIGLGQKGTDLSVRVGTFSTRSATTTCAVIIDGPMARIAAAAASAARVYRPFTAGNVTPDIRARTFVVTVHADRGAVSCGVRHIVLQLVGAPGLESAIQPIHEGIEGSTFDQLPAGDFQVVVATMSGEAPKVRVSAKDRARLELAAGLSAPATSPRAPAPVAPPATARTIAPAPAIARRELRLSVSGDAKHAADAIAALRTELQAAGVRGTVVQPGDTYDYRIVFAEGDRNAGAAIAIDASGNVVATAVRAGFTEKGAAEASARDLAKKLIALAR
jgi:hypothetical protein